MGSRKPAALWEKIHPLADDGALLSKADVRDASEVAVMKGEAGWEELRVTLYSRVQVPARS